MAQDARGRLVAGRWTLHTPLRRAQHGLIRLEDVVVQDGVVYVVTELLDALEAAHAAGLPHLDLRPGCVLVTADGRARLAGIGLAALRAAPWADPATTAFLAPEQLRGDPAGPPADLWSLGAILFLAVEGETLFAGDGSDLTPTAILTDPPLTPELAGSLAPALHALLTKPPGGRPTIPETRHLLEPLAGNPCPPAGAGSAVEVGGGSGVGVGTGSGVAVGGGSQGWGTAGAHGTGMGRGRRGTRWTRWCGGCC